jgi:PAS domain S-box-containing protein
MKRFLYPPVFSDPEEARTARLLHFTLWTFILAAILVTVLAILTATNTGRFLFLGSAVAAISAALLALVHWRQVRWASGLMVVSFWGIVTAALYTAGGVRAPMYMGYIVIIFFTGLLRGGRAGAFITLLCSLSGLWLAWLEITGQLPVSAVDHIPLSIWLTSLFFFWTVAALQYLSAHTVREALMRATRELEERKHAEAALRESEDLYRRAITAAGAVPYYQDGNTDHYSFMGEGIKTLTGFSPSEMNSRVLNGIIEEQQLFGDAAAYASVAEAAEHARQGDFRIWRADLLIHHRDGQLRWIADSSVEVLDERGKSKGSIGILQDITARKETEMAAATEAAEVTKLYRAAARLLDTGNNLTELAKRIADAAVEEFVVPECGVWIIRDDGRALTRLAYRGYAIDYVATDIPLDGPGFMTAVAKSGQAIYAPDVLADSRYLAGDERTRSELVTPMKARQTVIGILNMESPQLDSFSPQNKRLVEAFAERAALALDNTRLLISLEQAVKRANDFALAAEEASRIKSQFLTNTSHELRTPLTSIIGALDIVKNDLYDTRDEEMRMVDTALDAAQNLATTLDDLIEIAKIETGRVEVQPQITALSPILDEAYKLHRILADHKDIAFQFDITDADTLLYADSDKLRRILLNLIGNAIKFTDEGSVNVSVRADRTEKQIKIMVTDTGIGVAEEVQARLFQPFVQADGSTTRRFGGNGLGLSISRHLAEMMGGTLTLYSAGEGQGTTLTLELPLAEPQPPD